VGGGETGDGVNNEEGCIVTAIVEIGIGGIEVDVISA
jgi:hypothetical protein